MTTGPPSGVLGAFGVSGRPSRLPGGEGTSWRAGQLVLKPAGEPEEANWVAEVLAALDAAGFRTRRPVRSASGTWIASGWSAWEWLDGEHDFSGRWPEVLKVGEDFHRALFGLSRPAFLDRRTHQWSIGDRAAWGEARPEIRDPGFREILERLYGFLRPIDLPSQVIHGDLAGNVLFAPGQPPAVIDFSPYYRPVGFALAIVIIDAIAWHGAGPELASHAAHLEALDQLLARAAIYRLVTADMVSPLRERDWAVGQVAAHRPIVDLVGA